MVIGLGINAYQNKKKCEYECKGFLVFHGFGINGVDHVVKTIALILYCISSICEVYVDRTRRNTKSKGIPLESQGKCLKVERVHLYSCTRSQYLNQSFIKLKTDLSTTY